MTKRKVIFIHGMGVRKDSRGIFTDIANSFSNDEKFKDIECVFTDLNVLYENGDLFLNSLDVQAEIIQKVVDKEKEKGELTLICHSQGCVVATLLDLPKIEKVFFLAPPTNNDLQRSIDRMKKRSGTVMNLDGESIAVRSDGTKTIIPKEYWENRKTLIYLDEYKSFSEREGKENLKIVIAKQDEIVAGESVEMLKNFGEVFQIDGNHNFDNNRDGLAEVIKENF